MLDAEIHKRDERQRQKEAGVQIGFFKEQREAEILAHRIGCHALTGRNVAERALHDHDDQIE
ncbi:hypothetical protein SDC9_204292 [bioreactor metagenome]|uniref:Uncharacterized protein n=1 Tax=bioreactor metagenome TaxID=1076179 RepID=A0A645J0H9_9ZZZZ